MPARFRAILVFEGLDTGDKRTINPGALIHRELPLTMMGMTRNPDGGWEGHSGAEVAGSMDTLSREDASSWVDGETGRTWGDIAGGEVWAWVAEGSFADRPEAADIEQLVRDQHLRGVSVDIAAGESELEILEEDEDGWPIDWLERVTAGEIAAATICNIPAFRGCTIELVEDDAQDGDAGDGEDAPADDGEEEATAASAWLPAFRLTPAPRCPDCAVVAAGGPLDPPAAWFADPGLDRPTPLTVTSDGRVFGHLAAWGTCHTGMAGQCVTPPRSSTGYSLFRVGAVRCDDGTEVPVGHITLGTGHADLRAGARAAASHYDDTGTVVADVACGEDDHGIWVSGALRPGLSDVQVRALRSAPLSGDWRRHGNGLELVAALAVNVPGFPVPRVAALAASGAPAALVAAGARPVARVRQQHPDLTVQINTAVNAAVAPLLPLAKAHHLARIRAART